MRKFIGYFWIIVLIPITFLLVGKIGNEMKVSSNFQTQLEQSIPLTSPNFAQPVFMKDKNGVIFSEEYVEYRIPLTLEEIPLIVQELFIQSEDKSFYSHVGYNLSAIIRAVVVNSEANSNSQGASTITQQLVRMRYLSEEKTYERKVTELMYAYELEKQTSKDAILEMYLNEMYFSNQVYGIGAAAQFYFQKEVSQLSLAQLAFLAAIPNNPSLYDPFKKFENTKSRQQLLLEIVKNEGLISEQEFNEAIAEKIYLKERQKKQQFPEYSTFVYLELQDLIAEKEGFGEQLKNTVDPIVIESIEQQIKIRIQQLFEQGIVIETNLNPYKQRQLTNDFDSSLTTKNLQAAATVIDNDTRGIVAVYPGKGFKKFDFHRAYQAIRQPGSAIKPLLDYGPYFDLTNATPETMTNAGEYCIRSYCPENYDGAVYGDVTIRQAFRYSYNTAALRILQSVGLQQAFAYLNEFHFQHVLPEDRTQYSTAIGGFTYGVTPKEMADAYTSFIDGSYVPSRAIKTVKLANGEVLYDVEKKRKNIWQPNTVANMRELLRDVVQNGTAQGVTASSSYIGAKTGTTNNFNDYWLVGLTDQYTSSVWIGYDQPASMENLETQKIHHNLFSLSIK